VAIWEVRVPFPPHRLLRLPPVAEWSRNDTTNQNRTIPYICNVVKYSGSGRIGVCELTQDFLYGYTLSEVYFGLSGKYLLMRLPTLLEVAFLGGACLCMA